jgi:DNA processing protein
VGGGCTPHPAPPIAPAALRARILRHLGPSPLAEDQLIRDMKLPPSVLSPELTFLELEGKVSRQPGGLISLAAGPS